LHEEFGIFFGEIFIGFSEQFDFIAQDLLAVMGNRDSFFRDVLGHTS
jgi:hypothetical protein